MKRLIYPLSTVASFLLPVFAFAQTAGGTTDFSSLQGSIVTITNLINELIPLVIGIGVLVFLWGLVGFVTAGGDEEKKKNARSLMIYGIIVLFVMVSVWGLVNILVATFNTKNNNSISTYPQVP